MDSLKFPIASILFEGDLRLAVLQALSIDRLYDLSSLTEYSIILNGTDNESLERYFRSRVFPRLSSGLREKIVFLDWSTLLQDAPRVGYYDQQALKLSLGFYYSTDMYLMLDAKNHFTQPAGPANFFVAGKPAMPVTASNEMWRPRVEASLRAVNNTEADPGFMLPSITPYLMYAHEVRGLVEFLVGRFGGALPEALRSAGGTEFLLYYGYIEPRLAQLYTDAPQPVRTLFTSWPQDPEIISLVISEASKSDVPMFGLHRNRLPQLTALQRDEIVRMWESYLLSDWENAEWFLSPT